MKRLKTTLKATCLGLAMAVIAPSAMAAESYPDRPITIVVGYAAGGTTDIIARLVGKKLSESLGQPVVVENRAGAGGNIGAEYVTRAKPDGYTLHLGTAGNITVNPSIYTTMNFDTVKDFDPISLIATLPNLMVVNPKVPANTVKEFVAWAKDKPDVFFASSGVGSTIHLTGELFNMAADLNMTHVPYKGSGPALTDLIAGSGPVVMSDNMPSSIGMVRAGQLKALAVTGPKREASAPEIPTVMESGYPEFNVVTWFGLFAPADTPKAIVDKLNAEVVKAVKSPEVNEQLQKLGATPTTNTPAEFRKLVESDRDRWAKVVKAADIKM